MELMGTTTWPIVPSDQAQIWPFLSYEPRFLLSGPKQESTTQAKQPPVCLRRSRPHQTFTAYQSQRQPAPYQRTKHNGLIRCVCSMSSRASRSAKQFRNTSNALPSMSRSQASEASTKPGFLSRRLQNISNSSDLSSSLRVHRPQARRRERIQFLPPICTGSSPYYWR